MNSHGIGFNPGTTCGHTCRPRFLQAPTDTTNLDYFEMRYRVKGADTWSYTTARPQGNAKTLFNDQHGTECGREYQVRKDGRNKIRGGCLMCVLVFI